MAPFRKRWIFGLIGLSAVSCGLGEQSGNQADNGLLEVTASDPVAGPLFKTFGVLPYLSAGFYRHEWEDYAKCMPAQARDVFVTVANRLGIDVYDLYTVAMGEGLGFHFDRVPTSRQLLESPVDGFAWLGVDFFVSEAPGLRREGLLPSDFTEGQAYSTRNVTRNEPGDNGQPISLVVPVFFDFARAIEGFGAVYASRSRRAEEAARSLGLGTLNPDQRSFWAYFFYQNPGAARQSMSSNGLAPFTNQPDSVRPKDIRTKSLKRVVTSRYFNGYAVLTDGVECKVALWTE